jgi:hypothetical protein
LIKKEEKTNMEELNKKTLKSKNRLKESKEEQWKRNTRRML